MKLCYKKTGDNRRQEALKHSLLVVCLGIHPRFWCDVGKEPVTRFTFDSGLSFDISVHFN